MKRLTENEQSAIAVGNALTEQRKRYEKTITRLELRVMLYEKEITEMRQAIEFACKAISDSETAGSVERFGSRADALAAVAPEIIARCHQALDMNKP